MMKTGISYFGVREVEFVRRDMEEIADQGFTHVLHTCSEEDFQYYGNTMHEIINCCKDYGLKVYVNPWGVGRVFGGEAYTELAGRNPIQAQVTNHGNSTVASCINHRNFREYMLSWVDFVCNSDVETIFWDEPHWYFENGQPDLWSCRCETCQKLFRKQLNHIMPSSRTESVQKFRQESILNFLSEMTKRVRKNGKRNSVCVLPPTFESGLDDWEQVAKMDTVDEIGTDPYWSKGTQPPEIAKSYHKYSQKILSLADQYGKEAQMWIKNYGIEKNGEQSVAEATYAAYNEGLRNIFAWSYKGCKNLSALASEDWEKVWQVQIDAFAECHEKAIMNEMIQAMRF